jgi:hypothetical protein
MKKWIVIVFSLVALLLIAVYFLIPGKIVVTRSIAANANQSGAYRFLTDASNWSAWWPGSSITNKGGDTVLESGGYRFQKPMPGYYRFSMTVEKGEDADSSFLQIFSPGVDSLTIAWTATIKTGSNPVNKFRNYFKAKELGKTLDRVLIAMEKHISDVKNIYGMPIKKEKVKTEFLVSLSNTFGHYPSTGEIYELLNKIRKYVVQEQAKEVDHPMIYIKPYDSTKFEAQVAIPVDKAIAETAEISLRRMLLNGNILVAEVTGGKTKTDQAMKQVEIYVSDHKYYNVALPFYSLVTDRMSEPDSSKWVTRIYYPIL